MKISDQLSKAQISVLVAAHNCNSVSARSHRSVESMRKRGYIKNVKSRTGDISAHTGSAYEFKVFDLTEKGSALFSNMEFTGNWEFVRFKL